MNSSSNNGGLSPSDRSLVYLVRGGDQDAAQELYDRYARRVLGLVKAKFSKRMQTMTEPEDVVQSIFRSVFRGVQAGNYNAPEGSTLWNLLAVISVHKMRKGWRHYTAQCRNFDRNIQLDSLSEMLEADENSGAFVELCVKEILEFLPENYQDILSLRMQGFKVAEIAEKTGHSSRTVERILQKCREQLASILLDT